MAQCPNGTQVAPGAPASFWVFDFPFLNFLAAKLPALANVIATIVSPELVITSNFCIGEPVIPTPPTLSDYALALTPWGNMSAIVYYWKQVYKSSVFPTYCQCQPGGSPAGSLEAFISSTYSPLNWWKYDDLSLAVSAHDSGSGASDASMVAPYAFNTAKICPNASSTCLTTTGGYGNAHTGGGSSLNTRTEFSVVGFFQTTDTSHAALWGNYHSVNAFLRLGKDLVSGKLYVYARDTGGTQSPVESTNADFHNGSTHLFVFSWDKAGGNWNLYSDNGRSECTGPISALSYWDDAAPLFLQNDQVANLPFGGKSQDWFITNQILTANDAKALYFNAGLGGGPVYVPVAPVAPTTLPASGPAGQACSTIADVCTELQTLYQAVLNVQHYQPPATIRSFALATVHAGLTSNGSFAQQPQCIGVQVDITTKPAGWGNTDDLPIRLIPKAGDVQTVYAGAYADERQVHYMSEFLLFSDRLFDHVNYNFRPGFVATITELIPGP